MAYTYVAVVLCAVSCVGSLMEFDQDPDTIADGIEPLIARIDIQTTDTPGLW